MRLVTIAATIVALAWGTAAAAQTPSTAKPSSKRAKEFLVGGIVAGPSSVGSASAELLNGSGEPSVTLFRIDNRLAAGFGVESNIGFQISRTMWIEICGGWTRSNLDSEIRDDFEDAFDETLSSTMSRFTVEGGLLKYFHDKGKTAWFIRLSGGWMRETAGGNTLTGDGLIAGGGLGLRHWFRTAGKGSVKRIGLRVEGRATIRSGGISLGEEGIRFGPAGAAHLVFGF